MKNVYHPDSEIAKEITPKEIYLSRRSFLKAMGFAGSSALLAACAPKLTEQLSPTGEIASSIDPTRGTDGESTAVARATTDELGNPLNSFEEITNYNNYYEFTTDKQGVAKLSAGFDTSNWEMEVSGFVKNPQTYLVEDLVTRIPQKERIYRLRCVEAWSMVIPWLGFPLAALLQEVEPTPEAKYVKFTTLLDTSRYPGQKSSLYPWPYEEGLRLDEAMNDLTFLATGLYGESLPPQDGAPIRLVVPWKYGFKSIKAIKKIELVAEQPRTMWETIAPNEYGFYANVNPAISHPRWSQSSERRIGEIGRKQTLLFNGYEDQVAALYEGLNLVENY